MTVYIIIWNFIRVIFGSKMWKFNLHHHHHYRQQKQPILPKNTSFFIAKSLVRKCLINDKKMNFKIPFIVFLFIINFLKHVLVVFFCSLFLAILKWKWFRLIFKIHSHISSISSKTEICFNLIEFSFSYVSFLISFYFL